MDFRILGPLEVVDGERRLALGGTKQRALLGLLLLHAGQVVSSDHLLEQLWTIEGSPEGSKALQVAVSRLRRVIEPDCAAGGGERRFLLTRPPGYELHLEPGTLDLHRFEDLVAAGRIAETAGDPAAVSEALGEALGLWRGAPLSDLAYQPFAQTEIARLEELRVTTLERRIDADLELGRHAELIGELEALVAAHPLREGLRRQSMLALYRAGRQAEALEEYRAARRASTDELGLEPGPDLRTLEQAMLTQEGSLDWKAPSRRPPPGADSPPRIGVGGSGSVLVGRERELGELMRGLDDAFAGRGALVLLGGEPGIGKSRLAEELLLHAGDRGARVLIGRCWEAGGAPAYWPWVQSLRGYVGDADTESLRSQLGAGAAEIAQLLPELGDRFPDLPAASTPDSEGARFRLFDAMAGFLRRAAGARPIVLALDDLHAADEPSLLLMRFLVRDLGASRLLIVGAYRDVDPALADPLTSALSELGREPVCRMITLTGLEETDVARYIEVAAPGASKELAAPVHADTGGNPLFVGEIVRLLVSERRLEAPASGPLPIPPSVTEVIGRRLRRLPPESNRLLALASVLGREFDLQALGAIGELEGGAVLELLDEPVGARLVAEVPGTIGRMRFAHALIRDTVYQGLSPSRRAQLHRQTGEALEALHSENLDLHLAELAHHFSAAGDDEAKAVDYARRAGAHAVSLLAYEEAVRLYVMALEALGTGARSAAPRCELLVALADARGRAGNDAEAKSTFLRAARLAKAEALPELLARAAAGYGGRFLWSRSVSDPQLVPLLEDALAALDTADAVLRVQLLSRLAAALRDEPSRTRRVRMSDEAVRTARATGDPMTLAYALDAVEAAVHGPETARRRLADGGEIVALARGGGDRERQFNGHEHTFWVAWELGDPARRAQELAAMESVGPELRQPAQLWAVEVARAGLALSQGRFGEAEALMERAAAAGRSAVSWNAAATRRLQLFLLHRHLGGLEALDDEIRASGHEFASPLIHRAVLAYVCARVGHASEAAAIVAELTDHDLSDWHVDEEWLFGVCILAEACATLGDTGAGARLYEVLTPYASLNAIAVPEAALDSTSRALGILATLLGRLDDAAGHFEEALDMNQRMGAVPWLAHTRHAYADMLGVRGGAGDRTRAEELRSQALATYRELGMQVPVTRP
jgi:DNA-binding SARP family transcriptional activator